MIVYVSLHTWLFYSILELGNKKLQCKLCEFVSVYLLAYIKWLYTIRTIWAESICIELFIEFNCDYFLHQIIIYDWTIHHIVVKLL